MWILTKKYMISTRSYVHLYHHVQHVDQECVVSSEMAGMLGNVNLVLLVLPARGLLWVGGGCMCSPEYDTIKIVGSL